MVQSDVLLLLLDSAQKTALKTQPGLLGLR